MSFTRFAFVSLSLLAVGTAAEPPPPSSYKPYGVLADVMQSIMLPNSEMIFGVTRKAPTTEEGWLNVEASAVALAEAGNILLMKGRMRETGEPVPSQTTEWKRHVQALVEAAKGAHAAALTKDPEKVFDACEPLYRACYNCHQTYRFGGKAE